LVAAESLGLGTVYIGGLRNDPERVARTLHLPPQTFAVFGLCVGWPAEGSITEVKPRLPQAVVLHREVYGEAPTRTTELQDYDQVMRLFYEQHAMGSPEGWAKHAVGRVETVHALRGRHRLGAILKALGFAQR
jgi:hypothetical protein